MVGSRSDDGRARPTDGAGLPPLVRVEALARLPAELTRLELINLATTSVTDAGLAELARLKELKSLSLSSQHVTDAGLKEVARVTSLTSLYVGGNALTDAGLADLSALARLKTLTIINSPQLTAAGIARLQKALPECKIAR